VSTERSHQLRVFLTTGQRPPGLEPDPSFRRAYDGERWPLMTPQELEDELLFREAVSLPPPERGKPG